MNKKNTVNSKSSSNGKNSKRTKAKTRNNTSSNSNVASDTGRVRGRKALLFFRGVQTIGVVARYRKDRGGVYYVDINTDEGIVRSRYTPKQLSFL
jgi:hypothetical protein